MRGFPECTLIKVLQLNLGKFISTSNISCRSQAKRQAKNIDMAPKHRSGDKDATKVWLTQSRSGKELPEIRESDSEATSAPEASPPLDHAIERNSGVKSSFFRKKASTKKLSEGSHHSLNFHDELGVDSEQRDDEAEGSENEKNGGFDGMIRWLTGETLYEYNEDDDSNCSVDSSVYSFNSESTALTEGTPNLREKVHKKQKKPFWFPTLLTLQEDSRHIKDEISTEYSGNDELSLSSEEDKKEELIKRQDSEKSRGELAKSFLPMTPKKLFRKKAPRQQRILGSPRKLSYVSSISDSSVNIGGMKPPHPSSKSECSEKDAKVTNSDNQNHVSTDPPFFFWGGREAIQGNGEYSSETDKRKSGEDSLMPFLRLGSISKESSTDEVYSLGLNSLSDSSFIATKADTAKIEKIFNYNYDQATESSSDLSHVSSKETNGDDNEATSIKALSSASDSSMQESSRKKNKKNIFTSGRIRGRRRNTSSLTPRRHVSGFPVKPKSPSSIEVSKTLEETEGNEEMGFKKGLSQNSSATTKANQLMPFSSSQQSKEERGDLINVQTKSRMDDGFKLLKDTRFSHSSYMPAISIPASPFRQKAYSAARSTKNEYPKETSRIDEMSNKYAESHKHSGTDFSSTQDNFDKCYKDEIDVLSSCSSVSNISKGGYPADDDEASRKYGTINGYAGSHARTATDCSSIQSTTDGVLNREIDVLNSYSLVSNNLKGSCFTTSEETQVRLQRVLSTESQHSNGSDRVVSFDMQHSNGNKNSRWKDKAQSYQVKAGSSLPMVQGTNICIGDVNPGLVDDKISFVCESVPAGKYGMQRKFKISEYEEEGNARVVYNSYGGPEKLQLLSLTSSPIVLDESGDDVVIKVQVSIAIPLQKLEYDVVHFSLIFSSLQTPKCLRYFCKASTVSKSDCLIRRGQWWGEKPIKLPSCPGVDFVGIIDRCCHQTMDLHGFRLGDRVASLVRRGGNSRYITLSAKQLVKVPPELHPARAACLVENYLAAFQSLHLDDEKNRYRKDSLLHKCVLVIGGISQIGQAIVQLALAAGATAVYVTAKRRHHVFLRSLGSIPLHFNDKRWLPQVRGQIDIVIDPYSTGDSSTSFFALSNTGKLVCGNSKLANKNQDLIRKSDLLWTKKKLGSRIYPYDIYDSWGKNFLRCKVSSGCSKVMLYISNQIFLIQGDHLYLDKEIIESFYFSFSTFSIKNDLHYIFALLSMGIIDPPIVDTFPLSKVSIAQKLCEARRVQGYLICEPWLKQKKKALYC